MFKIDRAVIFKTIRFQLTTLNNVGCAYDMIQMTVLKVDCSIRGMSVKEQHLFIDTKYGFLAVKEN